MQSIQNLIRKTKETRKKENINLKLYIGGIKAWKMHRKCSFNYAYMGFRIFAAG